MTSKFQSTLGMKYYSTIKTILKYFRRTKDLILTYGGGDLIVESFIDFDSQLHMNNTKIIFDFVFTCNRPVIN